ncbi:MAG TPA: hypothetical protein VIL70_05740 [Chthoniobacterales bacterium]
MTVLFGEMLAAAEYFIAGQSLKLKASTPSAALDEAILSAPSGESTVL